MPAKATKRATRKSNGYKFEVYHDFIGGYRWRLKAGNGEIIAQGESYVEKEGALACIELVKKVDAKTPVNVIN